MKKVTVFYIAICVALLAIVGTVFVMNSGIVERTGDKLVAASEEINYAANAKSVYVDYVHESETIAKATGFNGFDSYRTNVNGTEIEITLFYIDGNRVSADEYMAHINDEYQAKNDQIYELATDNEKLVAENNELSTFGGFLKSKFGK